MKNRIYQAEQHYNILGIGVGPANLSLASLIYDRPNIKNIFLDQKESFSWHDDQMIEGATLQVSIFKDLSTLTDPTNKFTFLSYLHEKGRIYHFLNAQFDKIPRREFRDYLAWAAEKNENIVFGEKVVHVDFKDFFEITTSKRLITADHIVIGVGTQPWVPEFVSPLLGDSQYHVSQYMEKNKNVAGKHIVIVGGGQSGAEVFLDLLTKSESERPAHISWISRRSNYFPIDDSSFTNDFYMPCYSDYFNKLPLNLRQCTNRDNMLTSDGISEETLRSIYQKLYYYQFIMPDSIMFDLLPSCSVTEVGVAVDKPWRLEYKHANSTQIHNMNVDVIVWATGYQPAEKNFLSSISNRINYENNEFMIDDDFVVMWDGPIDHHIFIQNSVCGQRGLADLNLSLNAWRAQRILERLDKKPSKKQFPSFISWYKEDNVVSFL